MSGKRYRGINRPITAADRGRWPFSELPPTNLFTHSHLLRNLTLKFRSSSPAITKSWLPTPTRCSSSSNAHQRPPQLRHVITESDHSSNINPNLNHHHRRHNHFLGDSSMVETMLKLPNASHWCLLKSDTTARFDPPPTIPSYGYGYDHLGPPLPLRLSNVLGPNGPSSGLKVNYVISKITGRNTLWYDRVSVRHECTMADPFDAKKKTMEFTSMVHCEDKYYAMSLQGAVVVMQVKDTRLVITGTSTNTSTSRAVPSMRCRFFKEYLVEMKGEVLLVFLIHEKSLAVVDGVEVFRLDFDKLGWIRVERLRGKTMFLKEECIWVDSAEFGCRDDCVYFTQGEDNSWCVYDMKSCCISPVLLENQTEKIMKNNC